jgi:hypothetical protein
MEKQEKAIRNSLIAGSVAGIVSTSLFHPFDVVRTKMQSSLISGGGGGRKGAANPKAAFSSPFSAFTHTIQNGGYRSLYTGLSLPVAAQAVYKATVFTVNHYTRSLLLDFKRKNDYSGADSSSVKLSLLDSFVCGAIGGTVNGCLFVSPVEFVRNQLISQHSRMAFERERESQLKAIHSDRRNFSTSNSNSHRHQQQHYPAKNRSLSTRSTSLVMKGPLDVIQMIVKRDGPLGLWRGTGVTVARDSVGCGFFFLVFEMGREHFAHITGEDTLTTTMLSGAIAGVAFWTAALPFDTMKTLVQNGSARNMMSAFSKVGGIQNLTKGWQVALGKGAPGAAVTVGTYESVSKILRNFD